MHLKRRICIWGEELSGAQEGRHPMQGARQSDAQQKTESQKVARYRDTQRIANATVVLPLNKKRRPEGPTCRV